MATKKAAPAAKKAAPAVKKTASVDPRQTGTTTETHDHLAAAGARRRLADLDEPKSKQSKDDPMLTVRVPHKYKLHVLGEQGSRIVDYEAGINEMPLSHAEHDYSKAHGVEIVEDEK